MRVYRKTLNQYIRNHRHIIGFFLGGITALQCVKLILFLYGIYIDGSQILSVSYGAGLIILAALVQLRKCRFLIFTTILNVVISELERCCFVQSNCVPLHSPLRNDLGFVPQCLIWDVAVAIVFMCVIVITLLCLQLIKLRKSNSTCML